MKFTTFGLTDIPAASTDDKNNTPKNLTKIPFNYFTTQYNGINLKNIIKIC